MKKKLLKSMLLIVYLLSSIAASAYNFESGGIYYNITSKKDKTVEVTHLIGNDISYSGSVVIPASVTNDGITYSVSYIGRQAFKKCEGLTSVTIPKSVTYIGEKAFDGCTGLKKIIVDSKNNNYTALDGVLFNKDKSTIIVYPNAKSPIYKIPNSVTSIGDNAFYGCKDLTSVTIPNSVKKIGSWVFYNCTGLTSVTIPNSVTYINGGAFSDCTGLTSVEIPNSVTDIGWFAFSGCTGLTKFIVDSENNNYTALDGVLFNKDKTTIVAYLYAKSPIYTIPNSVTSIDDNAFYGCKGLKNVEIPNSVTKIGKHAFFDCTGLTSVTIPNSVTEIGEDAFIGCTGLTSVTIPNLVTKIGNLTFSHCTGLTSVTIPNSVTNIGWFAFSGCIGLTNVTIPNSVTYIGYNAFENCTGLTNVKIPNSVTYIDNGAFSGCKRLTNVTIPNSVTWIGKNTFDGTPWYESQADGVVYTGLVAYKYKGEMPNGTSITIKEDTKMIGEFAFDSCTSLTSVTIPNSVTEIGDYAFSGCENLKKIYNYSETPQSISENVFKAVDTSTCILYVPKGAVETYRASDGWKDFLNIKEF